VHIVGVQDGEGFFLSAALAGSAGVFLMVQLLYSFDEDSPAATDL